jgi:hypothetical protein
MSKTLFVLPVVAVSVLSQLMPVKAVADSPGEGSGQGQMVVDEVAEKVILVRLGVLQETDRWGR